MDIHINSFKQCLKDMSQTTDKLINCKKVNTSTTMIEVNGNPIVFKLYTIPNISLRLYKLLLHAGFIILIIKNVHNVLYYPYSRNSKNIESNLIFSFKGRISFFSFWYILIIYQSVDEFDGLTYYNSYSSFMVSMII